MNIAQNWRMNSIRYGLIGTRSAAAGTPQVAPRDIVQDKLPTPFIFEAEPVLVYEAPAPAELRQAAR